MSKLSRWLFLILTLLLLVMLPTKTAFALDENSQGQGGGAATDNQVAGKDGANANRSGYIIWLSDETGKSLNGVIAIATPDGREPYSSTGRPLGVILETRFGERGNKQISDPVVWGVPFFTSANGTNEPIVDAFMRQPTSDGSNNGAEWICKNYLDISEEQFSQYMDTKENVFLNVQPWITLGVYGGTENSHSGLVLAGTITAWAKATDSNTWMARYSHGTLANAFAYDKSWHGLSVPPSLSGKHSSAELLQPVGWGIVSYKLKGGDKDIIKTYYDSGTLSKTSYGTTTSPVNVQDEGSYIVKEWFTSELRTKLSGNQGYPRFESELAPKVQSGSGTSTVTMPEIEKTIVIRLEREEIPMIATSEYDVIYSHELNIVSPFLADYHRLDNPDSINNLVKFKLTESEAETIVTDGYSGSGTISDIKIKDDSFTLKHKVSGVSAENVRRNLYNIDAGEFATYSEISSGHEFALEGEIVPNYSVVVSRADSTWSDTLKVSNYREENTADKMLYATEVLGFGESNTGDLTGFAGAVENMDILSPSNQENSYSFIYDIKADYTETTTYEEDVLDEFGQPVLDAYGNVEKTTVTDTDDKTDVAFTDNSTDISYTVNMGCYKYRVDATPTASIATKGTINKDVTGGNGGVINHSPLTAQFLNSQSNTTLKFYPEVPYVYWSAGATEYSNPTQALRIYMMGERHREVVAPIVHGYYTTVESGSMKGYSDLASPQTGSTADAIYDLWADTEKISGVTAQGTTFSVGTTKEVKIHFGSIVLDCDPENLHNGVRSAWGNDNFEPKTHHTSYVGGIAPRINTDIYMKPVGGSASAGGYEPFILGTSSSGVRKTNEEELAPVQIIWKEGKIQNEGELIALFNSVFGANGADVYASWGLQEMLDTMYISSIDADKDNASGVPDSYPISSASDLRRGGSGNRWYDEESVTMYLVGFKTEYSCGLLTANDKVEYGFLKQSYSGKYDADNVNKNNSLKMEFYSRVYLLNDDTHVTADGFSYNHTSTFRVDKIDGASFAVSQATSSGMRK